MRRWPVGVVAAAGAAVLGLWGPASAAVPRAVPAGTGERVFDAGVLGTLYDTATTPEAFSSAAVGYVTPDGAPDVVAGFPDGSIHVWNLLTGAQELVLHTGAGAVQASPALVNLTSSPRRDILAVNTAGDVIAFDGTGKVIFHVKMPARAGLAGGFATPTVAYLDGNSTPWIIESGWDQDLWAWNLAGQVHRGFPVFLQDTSWSSPAVADIDGDGYPEIVVGYDCSGVSGQACYTDYHRGGGYLTVIRHDGTVERGWPKFLPGQTIWSSPAVGTLNPGQLAIVVGTGLYWPAPAGEEVLAFSPNGTALPGWPVHVGGRVFSSPAIGPVTGNAWNNVAVTADNGYTYLINPDGHIVWARCAGPTSSGCATAHSSPVLADVLDTGHPLVVTAASNVWEAFDNLGHLRASGQIPQTAVGLSAAPTVVSLSGHALLLFTLMAHGSGGTHGQVVAYTFPNALGPTPWGTFKQGFTRVD